MSVTLLDNLSKEVLQFTKSGESSINDLVTESDTILNELKEIEKSLEQEVANSREVPANSKSIKHFEKSSNSWYKNSISNLKSYNTSINKFSKNILNNSKFKIDLDDAYSYPLNLNNFPIEKELKSEGSISKNHVNQNYSPQHPSASGYKTISGVNIHGTFTLPASYPLPAPYPHTSSHTSASRHPHHAASLRSSNREELIKAIILHLLKIGQCDVVKNVVSELSSNIKIDEELLFKFELLKTIVDDIIINHDLSKALLWFKEKYKENLGDSTNVNSISSPPLLNFDEIEFKFHVLQYILLLNGEKSSFTLDNALEAYIYSKDNFPKFFRDHLFEISPLMSLLIYQWDEGSKKNISVFIAKFIKKLKNHFDIEKNLNSQESKFISELLKNFDNIHKNQSLFINLANEFISEYCKDLKLSNDSSLFQSVLAGFLYLPSFYKYKKIQSKLNVKDDAENDDSNAFETSYHFDLPFQLPDSSRFLFNYHPIFICPVSKEQLIPSIDDVEEEEHSAKKRKSNESVSQKGSPVVVLNFCQHIALRESVWQLSKKGTEIFKCHYCYKKHKFTDVTDAYFIDL